MKKFLNLSLFSLILVSFNLMADHQSTEANIWGCVGAKCTDSQGKRVDSEGRILHPTYNTDCNESTGICKNKNDHEDSNYPISHSGYSNSSTGFGADNNGFRRN